MTSCWKRWKGKRAYTYISILCTLASWCRLGGNIVKKHFRVSKCIPSKTYLSLINVVDVYFKLRHSLEFSSKGMFCMSPKSTQNSAMLHFQLHTNVAFAISYQATHLLRATTGYDWLRPRKSSFDGRDKRYGRRVRMYNAEINTEAERMGRGKSEESSRLCIDSDTLSTFMFFFIESCGERGIVI